MKKIILGAVALVGVFSTSSIFACMDFDYSKVKEGDPVPNNACPRTEKIKTYSTKEAFEKAEGKTCKSATDGCNTFFVNNGKVGGGTLMYCEDIYGKNGQEKWSCLDKTPIVGNDKDEHGCIGSAGYTWSETKKKCVRSWEEKAKTYPTKEAFIKAEGKTCETATDGVNTFFGKDFMASTMIGYPENFVAKWSCVFEKETKLSENDANLLKHLGKKLNKKLKSKIDNALVKYEKKLTKIKNPKAVNDKIIAKIGKKISDLIMKYPQDIGLPEKASKLYDVLEYLNLSLMNLDIENTETKLNFSETKDKTIINFIKKYIKNNKTSENTVKYTIAKIDLNADKIEEVFVNIEGKDFCGTGGCTTLLLKKEKNDYKLLNDFGANQGITISDETTNSYKNINFYMADGGSSKESHQMVFQKHIGKYDWLKY